MPDITKESEILNALPTLIHPRKTNAIDLEPRMRGNGSNRFGSQGDPMPNPVRARWVDCRSSISRIPTAHPREGPMRLRWNEPKTCDDRAHSVPAGCVNPSRTDWTHRGCAMGANVVSAPLRCQTRYTVRWGDVASLLLHLHHCELQSNELSPRSVKSIAISPAKSSFLHKLIVEMIWSR